VLILDQFGQPFPPPPEPKYHADRWENMSTGIGSAADKTVHGWFRPVLRVLDQELTSLHSGSDIAAKIVDTLPDECFRRGYDIEADGISASQTDAIRDFGTQELAIEQNMLEGYRWGRLYGGSILLLNIDDGGFPWEPLDETNIKSFDSISLVDRRYAFVQSQYSSLNGAKYGTPEIYLVSNAVACSGWNSHVTEIKKKTGWQLVREGGQASLIHESRVIRFDGNIADVVTRQTLAGWNWSVLQRVYNAMRQFEHAFDSAAYLLSDASQGVFKLQGLIKAITGGQKQAFMDRLLTMEMGRSVLRGIALDAGDKDGKNAEDFHREPTSFAGIPDLLDKFMLRLSSAADMPATKLFGRAPAGLNATGESDVRGWYDSVEAKQINELSPKAKRIYHLLSLAKNGPIKGGKDLKWKINWKPLWSPSDKEKADVLYSNSQRDKIYIDEGVVKPEEVAVDLSDVYPNLDVKAREAVLKTNESFDPYSGDPEPPAANGVGSGGPTSASGVNATNQGEPAGGPEDPTALLGPIKGGSTGPAKAKVGIPSQTQGAPSGLRPPKKKGPPARATKDAHDPKQPRNEVGKLGQHRATNMAAEAAELSENAGTDSEAHHEAAHAHAQAALEFRALARRQHRLGNVKAADKHMAEADEHDKRATDHVMRAGELGAQRG
jgi:uncharacterized protein